MSHDSERDSEDYYVLMDTTGRYISSTLPQGLTYKFAGYDIKDSEQFSRVFRDDPYALEDGTISGQPYNVIHSQPSSLQWKLVQLIAKDVFLANRKEIQLTTMALLGVLIVVSVPIVFLISRMLTSPIRDIVSGMNT